MKNRVFGKMMFILLIALTLVSGCMPRQPKSGVEESLAIRTSGFTYSTSTGAIWQVNANGHRMQLLPDDGIEKRDLSWSPNRQQLAYVAREFLQIGTREITSVTFTTTEGVEMTTASEIPTYTVKETLVVVDTDVTNRRRLAGPAKAIQYTWADDYTINLRLAYWISKGSERQQWKQFQVDVQTGIMSAVGQKAWSTPAPIAPSPDGQWALSFETTEGRKRIYLLDTDGKPVATVYERPVNQDVVSQWSPDSRSVLFLGYAFPGVDDIHVYDLATQKTTEVTHFVERKDSFTIRLPHWSPTGEWIFFVLDSQVRTNQPCLVRVSEGGLQCFEVSSKSDQFVWSLDGRYVAFLAPRGDGPVDIYVIDAVTGELLNLTQDGNDIIEIWITS